MSEVLAGEGRHEKELKHNQTGQEEAEPCLSVDDIIVYVEIPRFHKNTIRATLQNIKTHKKGVLLYTVA